MSIRNLINSIPENSTDEALASIESIKLNPTDNTAVIRCHLSNKFRLTVSVYKKTVTISAEGRKTKITNTTGFLPELRCYIYDIDDLVASGHYSQPKPKLNIINTNDVPPAPKNMDLPTWDNEAKKWYDAEY